MATGNILVSMGVIVCPAGDIVGACFRVVARKQAIQILGVPKFFAHHCCCVGICQHIVFEPQVVTEHIVNEPADERNV